MPLTRTATVKSALDAVENSCEKAVAEVLAKLGRNERFTDPTFPTGDKSLYVNGERPLAFNTVAKPAKYARLYDWSLEQVQKNKSGLQPLLWRDGGVKNTVAVQGCIGDCFLISAMASVADRFPEAIEGLFVKYDIQKGIYGIRLWLNGEWSYVVVDDLVGLDSRGNLLYGACQNPANMWLPILEKAVAKATGSFEGIDGGRVMWALQVLTGGVVMEEDRIMVEYERSAPKLWKKIKENLDRGDVLAGSPVGDPRKLERQLSRCKKFGDDLDPHKKGKRGLAGETIHRSGLVTGHGYSILDAKQFKRAQLIKIRNPYGHGEWKGAWSDGSKEMTEEAKAALDHTVADDGSFWMDVKDFIHVWGNIFSLRIMDGFHLKRQTGYYSVGDDSAWRRVRTFEISADKECEAVLILAQPDMQLGAKHHHGRKDKEHYTHSLELSGYWEGEDENKSADLHMPLKLGPEPTTVTIRATGKRSSGSKYTLRLYAKGEGSKIVPHQKPAPGEEQLRQAFAMYDRDGSGSLETKELYRVMLELDMFSDLDPEEQIKTLESEMRLADKDNDGTITFDEYVQLVENVRTRVQPMFQVKLLEKQAKSLYSRLCSLCRR